MKNAFIAVAALATVFSAQAASAHEDVNQQKLSRGKMTTGETRLNWKLEYTGCSKDKYLVTETSDGSLTIADPATLVPEKVSKIADIYNRTMANAVSDWLSMDLRTAKEIETGEKNIPRMEAINRSQKLTIAQAKFNNTVLDELGIDIIGSTVHFKVENISPAPSPECQ
jgi:hypothetical protein